LKTRQHKTGSLQRSSRTRHGRGPSHEPHHRIQLTPDGVPAALPDAPKPSPIVSVSAESRAMYPWLPARVIAGSVWRGPEHARVRVDDSGRADVVALRSPSGSP
jgi:hypothetical protein